MDGGGGTESPSIKPPPLGSRVGGWGESATERAKGEGARFLEKSRPLPLSPSEQALNLCK